MSECYNESLPLLLCLLFDFSQLSLIYATIFFLYYHLLHTSTQIYEIQKRVHEIQKLNFSHACWTASGVFSQSRLSCKNLVTRCYHDET